MKWIDIKHEDPKFDEHVILSTTGGVTTGRLIRIDGYGYHWDFNERNGVYWNQQKVILWMPLPEPPKQ